MARGFVDRSFRLSSITLAVMGTLGMAQTGFAQEDLGEMQVRGAPLSEVASDLEMYGAKVEVITGESIRQGGYTDVMQALLSEISGAWVQTGQSGEEPNMSMFGTRQGDSLLLVDGVQMIDRVGGFQGINNLSIINPQIIERVEVLKGGQSLFYGSNAVGGVINIVTKTPTSEESGEFGVGGGELGKRELFGNASQALTADGKHRILFYGAYTGADGYVPFPKEDYADNIAKAGGVHDRSYRRSNVGFKYSWDMTTTSDLMATASFSEGNIPDPGAPYTVESPSELRYPQATVKYGNQVSPNFSTSVRAYYRRGSREHTALNPTMEDTDGDGTAAEFDGKYGFFDHRKKVEYTDMGLNAMGRYRLGMNQFVFGVANNTYSGDWEQAKPYEGNNVDDAPDETESINAAYLQVRPSLPFSPSTRLALGGRVNSGEFGTKSVYNLSFKQPIGDSFFLRGIGGTSFKLPKLGDLYSTGQTFQPNPDLEPEEGKTFNIGFGGEHGAFNWELTAFSGETTNRFDTVEVDTDGDGDVDTDTPVNNDATTDHSGFIVDTGLRLSDNFDMKLSATSQEVTDEGSDDQVEGIPESMVKAAINFHSTDRTYHFSLYPRYLGALYARSVDEQNYGEYAVLDLAGQLWAGPEQDHRFSLRLNNVLDEEYYDHYSSGYYGLYDEGAIEGTDSPNRYYRHKGIPQSVEIRYTHRF